MNGTCLLPIRSRPLEPCRSNDPKLSSPAEQPKAARGRGTRCFNRLYVNEQTVTFRSDREGVTTWVPFPSHR